jgi:hypothetical protein
VSARSSSELAFARLKLVVDLEKTLYLLPCAVLRICGFRYVPAIKCSDGRVSPPCIIRQLHRRNLLAAFSF